MHPLVSILIPAYNSEKFIKATIQSALNQTYKNRETIIVYNGYSNNIFLIVREFKSKSIKVITQPNSGVTAA
jgi:glycosyltransferase involved in cell wall biosynthesis